MSTFKIEGTRLIEGIYPEWNWVELTADKYNEIFQKLMNVEQLGHDIANYIQMKKIHIGFHKQYKSGGGWTLLRNITLSPGDDPLSPYVLSLIIHETFHLKQSIWMRLSMQGELRAWQYQRQTYPGIAKTKGKAIGSNGEAYGEYKVTEKFWNELATLSPESRGDLAKAQAIMTKISPGYRAGCLPLFPLSNEIRYYWQQGNYRLALSVLWKLITCK